VSPRESREVARATGRAIRRIGFIVYTFRAGATGGIRVKIVSHGLNVSPSEKCSRRRWRKHVDEWSRSRRGACARMQYRGSGDAVDAGPSPIRGSVNPQDARL
jgi:hypothetical protein